MTEVLISWMEEKINEAIENQKAIAKLELESYQQELRAKIEAKIRSLTGKGNRAITNEVKEVVDVSKESLKWVLSLLPPKSESNEG